MDKKKIEQNLLSEKNELEVLINRVSTEEIIEPDSWRHLNEIGDESLENIEQLSKLEKLETLKHLFRRVNQSLEDLENNRYGICNKCEGDISEERLLANSHAQYCLECQSFVDKKRP